MAEAAPSPKAATALAVIAGYLILRCLWKVLVPATEYSLPPWPILTLIFDILMLIPLFILKPQIPAAGPDAPATVRYAKPLFVGGIVATVILVLIRFSSESGWWTGHLTYGF
jgi:hypothetical protein